ncbi:cell division protein FtsA [Halosquirtibacter xylanolyticus]|uniref:cell division protein FtsA n=1 Tax=Halosquirtibacter xylanolyticus TaxID=3374599 RepID=UPI00374A7CD7|nr:cell division protein FtsA [Prolixibacteraceae bacterium]
MNTYRQLETIVDIGTSKIVVLIGCFAPNRQVEIVGYGESEAQGVHRGVIMNSKETADSIKMALSMAKKGIEEPIKNVTVGFNGHKLKNAIVQVDKTLDPDKEINKESIQSIIKEAKIKACEGGNISYHVTPISFILNSETIITNPLGYSGKELSAKYHVITGPMEYQTMLMKCFEHLHLHVDKIMIHPALLGKYCLSKHEKEIGSAVVDLGCGLTTVAIYYKNRLYHTSSIPFGGEVITGDIMEAFQTINEFAEKLKKSHGTITSLVPSNDIQITLPKSGDIKEKDISLLALSEVIEARLEEINEAIVYQMQRYDLMEKIGSNVVMSGGGASFKGMKNILSFDTGKDIRVNESQNIAGPYVEKLKQPAYASALNLLQYTLEKSEKIQRPKVNFSERTKPKVEKESRSPKKTNKQHSFLKKLGNFAFQFLEDDSDELN